MLYSIISRVRVSPSISTMCCRWAVSMALGENLQVVMNSPLEPPRSWRAPQNLWISGRETTVSGAQRLAWR